MPWLTCDTPEHAVLQHIAIAFTVFYVAGIPLAYLLLLLLHQRNPLNAFYRTALAPCLASYHYRWYEVLVFGRRLLVGIILALVPVDSVFHYWTIVATLVVALIVQITLKPMKQPIANTVEEISLVLLILTFMVHINALQVARTKQTQLNVLFYLMIAINGLFCVGLILTAIVNQRWKKATATSEVQLQPS